MLELLLNTKTRSDILKALFNGERTEYFLNDIKTSSSVNNSEILKELKHLLDMNIIKVKIYGKNKCYTANTELSFYKDIVTLVNTVA